MEGQTTLAKATYYVQMIDANTGSLVTIMLGDITEIESNVHDSITQHDP